MYELCINNISEGSLIELQKKKKEASYEAYDANKDFIRMLADVWNTHILAAPGCSMIDKDDADSDTSPCTSSSSPSKIPFTFCQKLVSSYHQLRS